MTAATSAIRTTGSVPALDPDELAALEEERDFLLRSLDDLEREHAAGDLDEDDYRALRDDYTARAAEVLRAVDERRSAFTEARRPASPRRRLTVVAAIVLLAVVAGGLVAATSGRRRSGDSITGSVRLTATQEARRCVDLTGQGEASKAITCYQRVLDGTPDNPTALTYLGWTLVLSSGSLPGDTGAQALDAAKGFLAKAVAADPRFPDARAFRAVVAEREGRLTDAKAELDALDRLQPSPDIRALTAGLRDRVERELRKQPSGP